jgi:hypothetical protein
MDQVGQTPGRVGPRAGWPAQLRGWPAKAGADSARAMVGTRLHEEKAKLVVRVSGGRST